MLYFPCLALHEQINAVVLFFQDVVKVILEAQSFDVGLARYSNGLAFAWGGMFLDDLFNIVVVDIICAATSVGRSRLLGGPCPE